jgi:hypothetical protein
LSINHFELILFLALALGILFINSLDRVNALSVLDNINSTSSNNHSNSTTFYFKNDSPVNNLIENQANNNPQILSKSPLQQLLK